MNYMKKSNQSLNKAKNELASAVGNFMRYWGFRRIHGQIWLQLYISNQSLSGAELTRILKVSKALVSPALSELIKYGLIECEEVDKKTKKYTAQEDVYGVIKKVLKTRERELISEAQKSMNHLKAAQKLDSNQSSDLNLNRIDQVESMIATAGLALDLIIRSSNEDAVEQWSSMADLFDSHSSE
jgi:DNA-binding transcriptional regulator GbsR (MarR family)